MHIGVLTTGYPHRGAPVAGAFVRAMCAALARRGHTLTVLCAALPGDTPVSTPGVTVLALRYAPGLTFYAAGAPDNFLAAPFTTLAGGANFTLTLWAHARTVLSRCDALISHFALPSGLVGSRVRAGRPHLLVVHGTDGWLLARAHRPLQNFVLSGATHLQFTHRALFESLVRTDLSCTIRPMGVEWPDASSAAPRSEPKGLLGLLCVSRLVPVKRVHLAVALAHELSSRGFSIELTIAGDGPSREALQALASRGPCPVRFVGVVDRAARERLMFRSALMVHTAGELPDGRSEGAPVVLLEAMACGLPVLCTEAGGVLETVGHGAVVTTPSGLLREASELLTDPSRRAMISLRGRALAWELRWESEAARIEALLVHPSLGVP